MKEQKNSKSISSPADNTAITIDMMFTEAVKALDLKEPFTDKPISPEELIDILKEDVVYALKRPGSWEGANMIDVLVSHGFLKY